MLLQPLNLEGTFESRTMGKKKIDTTQELESESKKQSTFNQWGAGLQKKFDEMGTLSDVQGLLIAHGPQGELIDSCSNTSMRELYERFIESKYKHMLPLPDVNDIKVAISKRKGHVQGSEKDRLDAEFAEHMARIPLEESMRPVTAEELETLSKEHIGLMKEAVDANLEALRKFREQLRMTRPPPRIDEEDEMDHGLQTTGVPPGIDSTSMIQVSAADASTQEIQGKLQANEEQDDGLEDE